MSNKGKWRSRSLNTILLCLTLLVSCSERAEGLSPPESFKVPTSLAVGYEECNNNKEGLLVVLPPPHQDEYDASQAQASRLHVKQQQQQHMTSDTTSKSVSPSSSKQAHRNFKLKQFQVLRRHIFRLESKQSLFMCLLALSAGFGDVRSNRMYGCFVNMCTGNTIRLVTAVAEGNWRDSVVPAAVIVGYVAGVGLARMTKHTIEQQRRVELTITESDDLASTTTVTAFLRAFRRVLLPSPTSKSLTLAVCVAVTPMIMLFFAAAEALTFNAPAAKLWQAAVAATQAVAYGLMHMAATDATGGSPLFVVTGHWAGVSRCSVDYLMEPTDQTLTTLVGHARMVGSFIAGIACSVFFLDRIVPLFPTVWYPVHTMTGLVYTGLFLWYGNKSQ